MQNNLLLLSFQWFYKRFTYPLQLFTTKKLQANWQLIALLSENRYMLLKLQKI
jgi:hypothetical protein